MLWYYVRSRQINTLCRLIKIQLVELSNPCLCTHLLDNFPGINTVSVCHHVSYALHLQVVFSLPTSCYQIVPTIARDQLVCKALFHTLDSQEHFTGIFYIYGLYHTERPFPGPCASGSYMHQVALFITQRSSLYTALSIILDATVFSFLLWGDPIAIGDCISMTPSGDWCPSWWQMHRVLGDKEPPSVTLGLGEHAEEVGFAVWEEAKHDGDG